MGFSLVVASGGYSLVAVLWLLIVVVSLVVARNVKGGCSLAARSTGQIIGQITTLRILQAYPNTWWDPKTFPLAPP